tara:strand:- start:3583 stop:3762 length:180 start_codon:yes stop_codon:yes gene_type:complete
MNEEIMRNAGFNTEMDAVNKGVCPFCKKEITAFRDELSKREFTISGLCQKCQDDMFGEG